jgi:hypothetical protein
LNQNNASWQVRYDGQKSRIQSQAHRSHPANQNVSGAILVRGVGRLWAFI